MIKLHLIAAAALVSSAGATAVPARSRFSGRATAGQMVKDSEAIMDAVKGGNLQEVERLIDDMGWDLDDYWFKRLALNPQFSPLHAAALNNDTPMVALLLRKGADVSGRDIHNMTALHRAARVGATQIVEQLLDGGANIDELTYPNARTALHLAAESDQSDHASTSTVQLLL